MNLFTSRSTESSSSTTATNNNKSGDKKTKSTTNNHVDRYQHDLELAKAMRRGNKQINKKKELTESDILLGLDGLDKAELLQSTDLEEALKISQLSIELLLEFLRSDPSVFPNIDRDVITARIQSALTNAEEMKENLKLRQQQQQQQQGSSSPAAAAKTPKPSTTSTTSPQNQTKTMQDATSKALENALAKARGLLSKKSKTIMETKQSAGQCTSSSSSPSSPSSSKNTIRTRNNASNKLQQPRKKNSAKSIALLNNQDQTLVQIVKTELYVDPSELQNTSWDDIAGLATAKQSLQEAAILPLMRPDLFQGLRKPKHILLYGPPGTGKTMIVKAVAKESECLLFVVTSASITSKWHGEGEKLLRTLFQVARAAAPSIIFLDEVDALLSSRKSDGEHEASRRFKTEFMTQVDGIVGGNNDDNDNHLLLIACTNCPWDVDNAVLRRFPKRIYLPLPDTKTRSALLKKLLDKAGKHNLSSTDVKAIVKRLHGFSGSDIASIASEASFGPLRSLGGMDAIRGAKATDLRPISRADFERAVDQATKSVSKQQLEKYEDWLKNQSAT